MKMPLKLSFATHFLFVPENRPERYIKALDTGAAGVIICLEDAVGPDEKEQARHQIRQAWNSFTPDQKARLVIRCNAPSTSFYAADLVLAKELNVAYLLIPKSESADQINGISQTLSNTALIPMIETAIGLDQIQSIANSNQVLRLALGNLDLQADLGMQCDEQESQLNYARYQIVLASRLAQIAPPIDGVTPSTDDIARIQADALRAKQLGFGGKLCIHPKQVNAVKAVFAPSLSEIEWAKKVIKASQEAGGGAVRVDGKMVDHPVVVIAERILSNADKG